MVYPVSQRIYPAITQTHLPVTPMESGTENKKIVAIGIIIADSLIQGRKRPPFK